MDEIDQEIGSHPPQRHLEEDKLPNSDREDRKDIYRSRAHFQSTTDFEDKHELERKDSFFGEVGEFVRHPGFPTKSVALSLFLAILGIILIILGFIEEVNEIDPTRGICFWIIGGICSIPGFYFTFKIIQAFRANPYERNEILSDIPDL
ncbi:unnamed protein product [Moneuplotes crassus]|uniref:Transmembrane protein 230 n=1 Tax=Euplotes crassus TaxID=5936 RepID=A0AAD1Y1B4_EUPCR|nr:unnamed protein product [Moneuplotes crassus]